MEQQTTLKATGELTVTVTDEYGNVKDERLVKNLVVTVGREFIAARMVGTTPAVMSHMAIGTGTTAAAAANTTLGTEVQRNTLQSSTRTNSTISYVAVFGANQPASAAAITEAGIFNASSAGTMLCRTVFPAVNKGTSDTLTINWSVSISAV